MNLIKRNYYSTDMIKNKIKLGWMAGIIDGEGTISAFWVKPKKYKGNSRYLQVYIGVTNTDNKITEECRKITKMGGIYYRHLKHKIWNDWSCWRIRGESACKIAEIILPFLISKKVQAKVLLKWRNLERFVGYHKKNTIAITQNAIKQRTKIYNQMMKLNKRGK